MKISTIPLSKIVLDPPLQARVQLDMDTIHEYQERLHEGDQFPAVDVMDVDGTLYLVDGWHRYHAFQAEGCEEIDASILTGTFSDAVLAAAKSNKTNSLKRTSADKRRAVSLLLADEKWKTKSSNWIASELGVSVDLVCRMRAEDERLSDSDSQERVGRDGRTYRTENIGRKADKAVEDEWIGPEPDDPEFWRMDDGPKYEAAPGNAADQVDDFYVSGVRYIDSHLTLLPDNIARHEYLLRLLKFIRNTARDLDAAAAGGQHA